MGAKEILKSGEKVALNNNQFISSVTGKKNKKSTKKTLKGFGAAGFITIMIIIFTFLFSSGNIIPSAISERLIEETDVQYADAVESKKLVFAQALKNGDIPQDTANILEKNGVQIGYYNDGDFIKTNKNSGELVLVFNDKVISADDFVNEVSHNVRLYDAFNKATYSRAAYYYDEPAKKTFKKIGVSRNNYSNEKSFDEVMNENLGSGSNVKVGSVSLVKKTRINEGREETYYEYEENGQPASPNDSASSFINDVREKTPADNEVNSSLFSADTLKVADTISKEQRSKRFFVTFMENISKMKAGDGNESRINEAMNYLYETAETEIVDVKTGEIIKVTGSALESPSLSAILAGSEVNIDEISNYSSDRILKTIENQLNLEDSGATISGTIASSSKENSSIGRFIGSKIERASEALLNLVQPTVNNSLVDNSYETIKGIKAGEFLVEGAVNIGKDLAKNSGATTGDANAIANYARLNNSIIAMEKAVDRMNRSPFDITSRNTFLGSIIYNFAMNGFLLKNTSLLSTIGYFSNTIKTASINLLPRVFADETTSYLMSFGNCETLASIGGAVGSPHCTEVATFDTSTLNNTFNDPGFINFVNNNTFIDNNGNRTVSKNSALANFIIYNNERELPVGIIDGGILESLKENSSSINFISDILNLIETSDNSSEAQKRIASGSAFLNSNNNSDWQTYKYAQRYVSLARATATLRQYTDDKTAYNNIRFFEGAENPVMAFLNDYYLASK